MNAADDPRGRPPGNSRSARVQWRRRGCRRFRNRVEPPGECPGKQPGADDKDQGEGHLQRDDAFAQADTARTGSGSLAERSDQAAATGVESGSNSAQQASRQAGEEGEGEKAKAESFAQARGSEVVRQERDQ